VLATRHELCARADLWATKARNKYLTAPAFGERKGLPLARFDALWSCVTFSVQAEGEGDTENSRWQLVDDFVTNINEHRSARASPSELNLASTNQCATGTGKVAIGSARVCQCTLQLTVSTKMDVESKMRHAGGVDLCCGSAS